MIWLIEPQDPLLARDGRPFSATPGARARSLAFPFPSTTAGAARTRAGEQNGYFNPEAASVVGDIPVRGPLLVEVDDSGTPLFFAPAPGDALAFDEDDGRLVVRRLAPLARPAGMMTDLDDEQPALHLVGLARPNPNKPSKRALAFWQWARFEAWLMNPADAAHERAELGIEGLPLDRRMHVGIDPATLTGRDGALFMTGGLTFWRNVSERDPALSGARRLALAVEVDEEGEHTLGPGFGPMGGERRLMHWHQTEGEFPRPPAGLRERVMADGYCRVILLTPAYFEDGWRPRYLCEPRDGVTVQVAAAVVGKPQTVSGWDLVAKGPRASRRLAPAGSVYYLRLDGDAADIGRWFDATWQTCISDGKSDRDAGFGLAAVGVYSGATEEMSTEEAPYA